MTAIPSDTTAPQADTPHDELQHYNNSPCIPEQNDPLRYWGVHADILPLLTQLALCHLVVPASSAAVERLFSVGGGGVLTFFRPERCRLSDKTFEAHMCIKNNGIILLVCDINIIQRNMLYNSIEYDNLCAPDPIYYCWTTMNWSRINALWRYNYESHITIIDDIGSPNTLYQILFWGKIHVMHGGVSLFWLYVIRNLLCHRFLV